MDTHRLPTTPLRVAAVQMESRAGDARANLAAIESFSARAAQEGAQLIAFPECCVTGYWFLRWPSRASTA
jgi:predicted amidohydrolase